MRIGGGELGRGDGHRDRVSGWDVTSGEVDNGGGGRGIEFRRALVLVGVERPGGVTADGAEGVFAAFGLLGGALDAVHGFEEEDGEEEDEEEGDRLPEPGGPVRVVVVIDRRKAIGRHVVASGVARGPYPCPRAM